MNLCSGIQGKRHRAWVSLPTIAQGHTDEVDFEALFPPTKRFRTFSEGYIASPDIVSDIDTLECDTAMDVSINSVEDGEPTVEWWKVASAKQAHEKFPMLDEDDLMCHVCDSVYKKSIVAACSTTDTTAKPENSVLAYFKCTSRAPAKRISSTECVSEIRTARSAACSFCERSTCQACLDCCEKCQKQFCRLCIRNDYLGEYSRSLCLDCTGNGLREEVAMKIS